MSKRFHTSVEKLTPTYEIFFKEKIEREFELLTYLLQVESAE